MFRDFGAGNYIPCSPRQVFEQGVLFGGQFNQLSAAPDFVRTRVYPQVGDLDRFRPERSTAPEQCARPSKKLMKIERIGQVIIRPCVKSGDAIVNRVARSDV